MLHIIAILLLLCNIPRVPGWAGNPGSSCDHCCCCVVVTNEGTRNFYATTGGLALVATIPNCYYLQTHLDEVLGNWNAQGHGVEDANTSPGQYIYWSPTDPAYGCFNDFATVTATNFNASPSASVGAPPSNGGSSTTSNGGVTPTSDIGSGSTTSPQSAHGGLGISDRISLGVGLGVGLPAAIAAIWQMIRWYNGREEGGRQGAGDKIGS